MILSLSVSVSWISKMCTLDTLPTELLLHITTFIPSKNLRSLQQTSSHFHSILTNEKSWEIRAQKVWGSAPFPPIQQQSLPHNFHRISTHARESVIETWEDVRRIDFTGHIACVDAIYLFNQGGMVASGGRDRTINLMNVNDSIQKSSQITQTKADAHAGWIWDFCMSEGKLCSAGWDKKVKLWDIQSLVEVGCYETTSPVLCLSSDNNKITCGTFDGSITILDSRTKNEIIKYKKHKKSVLSIGMECDRIISISEDNRIVSYDFRVNRVINTLALPQEEAERKTYPKSSSFGKTGNYCLNLFYVGDIRGHLHLINSNNLKIHKTYKNLHKKSIQSVFHTLGGVYTCSADGSLLIHNPNLQLQQIHKIEFEKTELPKVHCLNDRLALARGDSIVSVYY